MKPTDQPNLYEKFETALSSYRAGKYKNALKKFNEIINQRKISDEKVIY